MNEVFDYCAQGLAFISGSAVLVLNSELFFDAQLQLRRQQDISMTANSESVIFRLLDELSECPAFCKERF